MFKQLTIGLLLFTGLAYSEPVGVPKSVQALADYVSNEEFGGNVKAEYYYIYSDPLSQELVTREQLLETPDVMMTLKQVNVIFFVENLINKRLEFVPDTGVRNVRLACIYYDDKNHPILDLTIDSHGVMQIEGQSCNAYPAFLERLVERLPDDIKEDIRSYRQNDLTATEGKPTEIFEVTLQPQMPGGRKLWVVRPQELTMRQVNNGLESHLTFPNMVNKEIPIRLECEAGHENFNVLFIDDNQNNRFEEKEKVTAELSESSKGKWYTFETIISIDQLNLNDNKLTKVPYPVTVYYFIEKSGIQPKAFGYYCNGWMQGRFKSGQKDLCVMLLDINSDGVYDSTDYWAITPFLKGKELQYLYEFRSTKKIDETCLLNDLACEIEDIHPSGRRLLVKLCDSHVAVAAKSETEQKASASEQTASTQKRIKFYRDFKTALHQARIQNKLIFIDFETDWCGYCKKMDQEVYPVEAVVEAAEGVIAVKVDGDREKQLTKKFNVSGYPTMVMISPGGNVIKKEVGYRTAEQMLQFLNIGIQQDNQIVLQRGGSVASDQKNDNALDSDVFCGTWTHSWTHSNQVEHQHIMKCTKTLSGRLRFEFIQQRYSYKPVFAGCTMHGDQLEVKFNMVDYTYGRNSDYSLAYVLKPENDALVGKLYESWSQPVDVTLKLIKQ